MSRPQPLDPPRTGQVLPRPARTGFAQLHQVFHPGSALPLRTRNCPGNDCWRSAGQFTDAFADRNSDGNSWCESNGRSWHDTGGNACPHTEVGGVILTIILLRRDRRRGLRGSLSRGRIGGTAAALARTNARCPIAADRCGEGHQENAGKFLHTFEEPGLTPVMVLFFSAAKYDASRFASAYHSGTVLVRENPNPLRVAAWSSCPSELLKAVFELATDHLVHIHQQTEAFGDEVLRPAHAPSHSGVVGFRL